MPNPDFSDFVVHFTKNTWPVPDLDEHHAESAHAKRHVDEFNRWALADVKGRPWYASTRVARRIRRWRRERQRRKQEEASADQQGGGHQ